jgi:hypothetical protein
MNDESDEIEATFARALATTDEAYFRMEEQLIDGAAEAEETIRGHLDDPDPMARLLAEVVLEATADNGQAIEKATRFLAFAERRAARSILRKPPAAGVAGTLTKAFGSRLAEFLALRLVQETQAPGWRVMTALAYLNEHRTPAATSALIRFAARTRQPQHQRAAIAVLRNIGDPELPAKLAAERRTLQQQGVTLPAALASLAPGGGGGGRAA